MSSSKMSRFRALASPSKFWGKWILARANSCWHRPYSRRTQVGSTSSTVGATWSTASWAKLTIRALWMPAVRG